MFTRQDIEAKATEMDLEVDHQHVSELIVNHTMSDVFKDIEGRHYSDAVSFAWNTAKPKLEAVFTSDEVESIQNAPLEEYGDDRTRSFTYSTSSPLADSGLDYDDLTEAQRNAIDLYVDTTEEKIKELTESEMGDYKILEQVFEAVESDVYGY